eukprot:TRINITY_DN20150_c0_g1_i1.p1 TRINITY_DN20150_c0_g1~~TRINITY_DN20150_c0_g1_i1.p1  ORF type:complete len:619 (-),score=85.74 TRINITY_DN20150_c0_g1_i1:24-1880(-)
MGAVVEPLSDDGLLVSPSGDLLRVPDLIAPWSISTSCLRPQPLNAVASRCKLMHLPADMTCDILWTLTAGGASICDIGALTTSCRRMRGLLTSVSEGTLWAEKLVDFLGFRLSQEVTKVASSVIVESERKCDLVTGESPALYMCGCQFNPCSDFEEAIDSAKPSSLSCLQINNHPLNRSLCIRIDAVVRLLHSALSSCDWLALSDISSILHSVGVRNMHLESQVLRAIVKIFDRRATLQSLEWLWSIIANASNPQDSGEYPNPEAHRLDSLRSWLNLHVAKEVKPWEEAQTASYFALFASKHGDGRREDAARIASLVLLAFEVAAASSPFTGALGIGPRGSGLWGLDDVAPIEELAVIVERAAGETKEDNTKLWSFLLLFLVRCSRLSQAEIARRAVLDELQGARQSVPNPIPAFSPNSSVANLDKTSGRKWQGLAVSWLPDASRSNLSLNEEIVSVPPPSLDFQTLSFPKLALDQRWVHSRLGALSPSTEVAGRAQVGLLQIDDTSEPTEVQFNAQRERLQGKTHFCGQWLEEGLHQQLPVDMFTLMGRDASLLAHFMHKEHLVNLDRNQHLSDGTLPIDITALFGIVGGARDGDIHSVLRCFVLFDVAAAATLFDT